MPIKDETIFRGVYSAEKYQTRNPIARQLVKNFLATIVALAETTGTQKVNEVGCGEGQLCGVLAERGFEVRGCDISDSSLSVARNEVERLGFNINFRKANVFELDPLLDSAGLIVCCEVLEHLEQPEKALSILSNLANPYAILSVPREPLWRILNLARGKYLMHLGNTPGHIHHWSTRQFIRFVDHYFEVLETRTPTPWTVLLCKKKV